MNNARPRLRLTATCRNQTVGLLRNGPRRGPLLPGSCYLMSVIGDLARTCGEVAPTHSSEVPLRKFTLALTLAGAALSAGVATDSFAGDEVKILVLKEHAIGSTASAQPYIDKLVEVARQKNGWSSASGKFVTSRDRAKNYIRANKPQFGIMSLPAYLHWRHKGLTVIGTVDASAGGRQYHVVSKSQSGLAGCKGKRLATNHADDKRFVNKIVAGGSFNLSDFTLVETRRPVQTLKKVIRDEADCALIDSAQLAELGHVDGGSQVKSVWKSATLPAMPVVAFGSASSGQREKFKASLSSLCSGEGSSHCTKVGIKSLKPASESAYSSVINKY